MTWPTKKLGEIALFLRGSGLSKKDLVSSGAHKCILYGQLYTVYGPVIDNVVSRTDNRGKMLSVAGDVLIPGTTTADEVGIAVASALNEAKVILGGDINIIRTENKLLNSKFLAYLLSGPLKMRMAKYARGTNIIHLSCKDIAKIEIPVAPIEIQKQIVERLDKIAEVQKLNDELIQKTDEFFQSLLHQELNPVGKNWEVKKLGEICEKTDQGHPKNFFKKEFRYIDISSIDAKAKEIQNVNLIPVDGAPSRARKIVRAGDIVFATTRPYLENIATVPAEFNNAIVSTGFCVIRANTKIAHPGFLYFTVISKSFIKKVLPFQRGANYPAVSDKDVFGVKIPLPPIKTQKQIAAKLSAVQDYKKQLLEQKSKLKELFDSVLSRSMSGKLSNQI